MSNELLDEINMVKNHSEKTRLIYKNAVEKYTEFCSMTLTAVIYFMASNGCASRKTVNLTIGDYINALSDYTNKADIYDILPEMGDVDDVVPT